MAIIYAHNTASLLAAIKHAKDGDTINLASGTYSDIMLRNVKINGNVTIQSADPAKPAVFTDLMVRDSSGLSFNNIEFAADPKDGMYAFQVFGSSKINFDNLYVHGTLNGDPSDDTSPFMIRNSSDVTVTDSEFEQLWHGISFLDSKGVTLSGNSFHDIRTDGIRGGGTSDLTIKNNYFTDFYPNPGEHPDGIQIWSTNTTAAAKNITITDNVVDRGSGASIQGIFIRDTNDKLPFENVKITGNTVIGTMYNGITVDGAKGLVIANNNVVAHDDQPSSIRVEKATNVTVSDNSASGFIYIDTPVATKTNNIQLGTVNKAQAGEIGRYLDAYSGTATGRDDAIAALVDKLVAKLGYADAPGASASLKAPSVAPTFAEVLLTGTKGADRLTVTGIADTRIEAGDGNDTLTGGGQGNNTLVGGRGDDNYVVRSERDTVVEAADGGNDTVSSYVSYTLGDHVETLRMMEGGQTGRGNALDNRIVGSAGDDRLYGEGGDDTVQGGAGNDWIWGGVGNDTLRGDDGDDMVYGDAGNDKLYGGAGNDQLFGGDGNDVLEGGAGADRLTGGAGADTFTFRGDDFASNVLASMDTITDFSSKAGDRISLVAIDAIAKTGADDKFRFVGTDKFSKSAGELRYEVIGGDSYVSGDTNGDGVADFRIQLIGVTKLLAADFIL